MSRDPGPGGRFVARLPDLMLSSKASAPVRRQLEPTHPCIRCGREGVPADAGLCDLCNPLELSQPSATQMHGIAAVGIIAFIVVLAVAGRVFQVGTGPFAAAVTSVAAASGGLTVTLSITNDGSNGTATTCRVNQSPPRVGTLPQTVQTPLVPAGETIQFTTLVTKFGSTPIDLSVDCGAA
jgi:hypothetical protein